VNRARHTAFELFLFRTGHLFVENPAFLVAFAVRFLFALRFGITELSESRIGAMRIIGRNAAQTLRSFTRGVVPVLVTGIILGYVIHQAGSAAGGTVHVLFDSLLMARILRDLLPLATALIVAARAGSAIAGEFAAIPAMRIREDARWPRDRFQWSDSEIYREVTPHVTATGVTAALFNLILVACVLAGYVSSDVRGSSPDIGQALAYASLPGFREPILAGTLRAAACGILIGLVASGFGIRASEEYASRTAQMYAFHDAIWESIVTSLIFCFALIGTGIVAQAS